MDARRANSGTDRIRSARKRRRRLLTRAAPIVTVAAAAFVGGLLAGSAARGDPAGERFAAAWQEGDLAAMYAELDPEARERVGREQFDRVYGRVARTATIERIVVESVGERRVDGSRAAVVRATVETHAFGRVSGEVELPIVDEGLAWEPYMAFPGLEPGETLAGRTHAGERGPILAFDGTPLAEGPASDRTYPLGLASTGFVGEVGSPSRARARELEARGFPPGTPAGISGLELAYDERLSGRPGGELVATAVGEAALTTARRVIASGEPRDGSPVPTTIDPDLQQAAVAALGGLFGGIAVLDARRGSVRALAGVAFSAPQPPGSTFKVITATAALDDGLVTLDDSFPVETANSEIGREITNSDERACGGTFTQTFAQSCNTVFAPLGVRVGGERLVEASEAFGFNETPTLHGPEATAAVDPPRSTIPTEIEGSVEIGVSAIGQGEVLATPLLMASVAQTIANEGVRMPTPIVRGALAPEAEPVEVTSPETAAIMRDLMIAVVREGTGAAAALPGVDVAGKTGTAELGPKPLEPGQELGPDETPEQELDAWFTAFAPARNPEIAVAVMIVNSDGDGGAIAAPIARQVLDAAL